MREIVFSIRIRLVEIFNPSANAAADTCMAVMESPPKLANVSSRPMLAISTLRILAQSFCIVISSFVTGVRFSPVFSLRSWIMSDAENEDPISLTQLEEDRWDHVTGKGLCQGLFYLSGKGEDTWLNISCRILLLILMFENKKSSQFLSAARSRWFDDLNSDLFDISYGNNARLVSKIPSCQRVAFDDEFSNYPRRNVTWMTYIADGSYNATFCWTICVAKILNANPLLNVLPCHRFSAKGKCLEIRDV
ncbi:hypothetical protein HG530_008461 [Fusarium avenaceum]|nr:hypothetical protein HG530_008461 [Fusarium avenaceum]